MVCVSKRICEICAEKRIVRLFIYFFNIHDPIFKTVLTLVHAVLYSGLQLHRNTRGYFKIQRHFKSSQNKRTILPTYVTACHTKFETKHEIPNFTLTRHTFPSECLLCNDNKGLK